MIPNICDIEFMYVFGYNRKLYLRYQHLKQFPIAFNRLGNDCNIPTIKTFHKISHQKGKGLFANYVGL